LKLGSRAYGEGGRRSRQTSGVDQADEHREPALGSAAHPRRTAQAWLRGRPVDSRQVHGQTPLPSTSSSQVTEAFPWDQALRYLLRDRDRSYGGIRPSPIESHGLPDPTAPRSPWQNGVLWSSAKSPCAAPSGRTLDTDNAVRTHRSLHKASPEARPIQFTGTSAHGPCSAGFTTITFAFRVLVHTAQARVNL
jgi:hypothetical protein